MGRRRRIEPHPVGGLWNIVVSAAPVAGRERRIYLRPVGFALRNAQLRLFCRLSLPALASHFLGRRSPGAAPLRSRRAYQGTSRGPARSICLNRFLVESPDPAAQRGLGIAGAAALFWKLIVGAGAGSSAGFAIKDFTWYQYLFTQFRAIFAYVFNFLLPVNLNVDWDFPISRGIFEY